MEYKECGLKFAQFKFDRSPRDHKLLRDCAKGVSGTPDDVGYVTTQSERDSEKTKDNLG